MWIAVQRALLVVNKFKTKRMQTSFLIFYYIIQFKSFYSHGTNSQQKLSLCNIIKNLEDVCVLNKTVSWF